MGLLLKNIFNVSTYMFSLCYNNIWTTGVITFNVLFTNCILWVILGLLLVDWYPSPSFTCLVLFWMLDSVNFTLLGPDIGCLCFSVNELCSGIWLKLLGNSVVLLGLVLNFTIWKQSKFGLGPILCHQYGKILLSTPWRMRFFTLAGSDFR